MILKGVARRKFDAIDRLTADHMKVELLFVQIRASRDPKRREELFGQIHKALEKHTRVEESTFYPACEKSEDLKPMILEAYEEHREVKTLLEEISQLTPRSEHFDAKLKVLIEDVLHHVREEENQIFPKAREFLPKTRLVRMLTEFKPKRRKKTSKAA